MGNSLPSFRRPESSIPVPICCARASAAVRVPSAISRSAKPFGNDVLHLLPYQFIAPVSELFLRLNIQQDNLPALVHHHHGIRSRLQQPAVPAFHLRQMLFRDFEFSPNYQAPVLAIDFRTIKYNCLHFLIPELEKCRK